VEEASRPAVDWLSRIRADDPRSWPSSPPRPEPIPDRVLGDAVRHAEFRRAWRILLGQHGGRGMYTLGGSFWEFGEPDWERTRLF